MIEDSDSPTLGPCPVCHGIHAEIHETLTWRVRCWRDIGNLPDVTFYNYCPDCGIIMGLNRGFEIGKYNTREEAAAAWNKWRRDEQARLAVDQN